ncbi:MAG TPA: hypothetical protein VFP53_06310 [Sphingomicrobium sp.]|nr:hypothetical protein [Sphingomicrobium sp.]
MKQGQSILHGGKVRAWNPDDLQSFTPLRFYPPEATGFEGVALVTDPDVFALGDIGQLFQRDLQGKAIWAVPRPGHNGRRDYIATSVMLLDCSKLSHWRFDRQLDGLFAHRFDYLDWMTLGQEDPATIGLLEPEWNDFDRLTTRTRLLHTTKRRTQPWKTGLPIDFTLRRSWPVDRLNKLLFRYAPHPDSNQEAFIFSLLAEMRESGEVTEAELRREMAANRLRHDSLELIDRYRGWDARTALAA